MTKQTRSRVRLSPQPLEKPAFEPYGDVIETEGATHFTINDGFAERFHDLAAIDVASGGGIPLLNIFRALPRSGSMEIGFLERHPLGSQAFIPLERQPFLVLVARRPEIEALRLFLSNGRQGVNYRRGVWHYPLLALEKQSDFIVIDRGGAGDNCEVHRLGQPAWIEIDANGTDGGIG